MVAFQKNSTRDYSWSVMISIFIVKWNVKNIDETRKVTVSQLIHILIAYAIFLYRLLFSRISIWIFITDTYYRISLANISDICFKIIQLDESNFYSGNYWIFKFHEIYEIFANISHNMSTRVQYNFLLSLKFIL